MVQVVDEYTVLSLVSNVMLYDTKACTSQGSGRHLVPHRHMPLELKIKRL
jgi:hypothetical protein